MLTTGQRKALDAVRVETEMASVIGASHFRKGQLGRGIGWTILDQLEAAGLIEYLGRGPDREIRITDAGRSLLETSAPVAAARRQPARLKMQEPRLKTIGSRIKPAK